MELRELVPLSDMGLKNSSTVWRRSYQWQVIVLPLSVPPAPLLIPSQINGKRLMTLTLSNQRIIFSLDFIAANMDPLVAVLAPGSSETKTWIHRTRFGFQ